MPRAKKTERAKAIWLPEPSIKNDTHKNRLEHTLDWLGRSTSVKATECRRFLNESVSKFPKEVQKYFHHYLHERWHTTFFELIVARMLQELGADLAFETSNSEGKRPDFAANFPDCKIIVEAIAPTFNASVGVEAKNRIPLLEIIDSNIPDGWLVGVWELPKIGPADSKQDFKRAVERVLDILPPTEDATDFELTAELPSGVIRLHLWPGSSRNRRVAMEGVYTTFDNSEERIRHAIRQKRRQVRSSDAPVLLAIQASGISSSFEDFDIALFGRTYESYDRHGALVETGFTPSGEFNNKSDKAPTYAGALAFVDMGWLGGPAPVLYRHPRSSSVLPESVLRLAQRTYDAKAGKIRNQPSAEHNLMQKLRFVQMETKSGE